MIKLEILSKNVVFESDSYCMLRIKYEVIFLWVFRFVVVKNVDIELSGSRRDLLDSYMNWVYDEYNKNRYLATIDDNRLDMQYAITGIQNEAAEISSPIMKDIRMGMKMDGDNMLEESGDILWYYSLWLKLRGIDIDDVIKSNVAKVSAIYPDGNVTADNRDKKKELDIVSRWADH